MNPQTLLHAQHVLVLNRAWQAIRVETTAQAIQQIMAGAATPLDVWPDGNMVPVKNWAAWMELPVREHDGFVRTVRGAVRAPTVVVCAKYAQVPRTRPKFSHKAVRARDGGRCQYTGRLLGPNEGSIDHVVPLSRGGANAFENALYCCREVNNRKGARTPQEAGLRPLSVPKAPQSLPVTLSIRNPAGIRDWEPFLVQ